MQTLWWALALLFAASPGIAQVDSQPVSHPDSGIHAQGCVQRGVEAGCLLVKDTESGKLYMLLIKGQGRPAFGAGIEFSGAPFHGITACMQGMAVEVSHWTAKPSLDCHPQAPPQE
jgi:hypothetical protein